LNIKAFRDSLKAFLFWGFEFSPPISPPQVMIF